MDKTINTLKYDNYAVQLPNGKYLGPFKTWALATLSKVHNDGKYIVKCTGIGELEPYTRSDGTVIDLGPMWNAAGIDPRG